MKKIITILTMSLFATTMLAQAPQKMSYQAVIRNAGNALVANATVGMRISVLQGTANGTAVYVETQNASTNANGLVTLEIGAGTVVSGTFASISWGTNAYFIKTETDPTGGTNYTIVGTSQFLSVPYALFAANSGSSGSSISGTLNKLIKFGTATTGVDSQISDDGTNIRIKPIGYAGFDPNLSKVEIAGSDNTLRLIGSGGFGQFGRLSFGDINRVYISEDADDSMLINGYTRTAITGGNVGIGTLTPAEKLDVNGKTKTTNLQVTTGAGAGKVLTSDATGNATWQAPANSWTTTGNNILNNNTGNVGIGVTPTEKLEVAGKTKTTDLQVTTGAGAGKVLTSDATGNATWQTAATGTVNQVYQTTVYNLNTTVQNTEVDFPTTNVIVPVTGTYLITYFLDARSSFQCSSCATDPKVHENQAILVDKTNANLIQQQIIDFRDIDSDFSGTLSLDHYRLPAHAISGSAVMQLNANSVIGFRTRTSADAGAGATLTLLVSNIALVRLF
ncbi:MAG: hypothetical protein V4670_06075 [Bacteroidota bacterium]